LASPGASLGSIATNVTSALLNLSASLQTYWDSAANRLAGATEYLGSATGLSPAVIYTTVGAVILLGAVPTAIAARNGKGSKNSGRMSRYGFSRGGLSPFSSTLGADGVPDVTEHYTYITSADLEDHGLDIPQPQYSPRTHIIDAYSHSAPSPAYSRHVPEDDVMLIKHQGVTYPEHFPAYSIGDGQLLVRDVRDRVKIIMNLDDRAAKRVKLYYKGRRLRNPDRPVREYGVKNNSEVLMILEESGLGSSSDSSEEIVVVGGQREKRSPRVGRSGGWDERGLRDSGPKVNLDIPTDGASRRGTSRVRTGRRDERSPRDSGSQVGLDVPADGHSRRATSRVRTESPSGSNVSAASAPAGIPGGPIEKLNNIAAHFRSNLLPKCTDFVDGPPRDPKKREDEHRKLAETVMQQVLLKLDEVDISGEEGARAWRKELVKQVQATLKELDDAKR
jgi:hypothetical protein